MSLNTRKTTKNFDSADEARNHAWRSLPAMYTNTIAVLPLLLTVPLFSITQSDAATIEMTWHTPGKGYIHYRGRPLTQSHQTVLFALIKSRAGEIVTNIIEFSLYELLNVIKWSDNSRNLKRVRKIIDDLYHANITIWEDGSKPEFGMDVRFMASKRLPEAAGQCEVVLSETLLELYRTHKTYINTEKRSALGREGLATFLYGYFSANVCNRPFKYDELHAVSGSTAKDMKEFSRSVRDIVPKLKAQGVIENYMFSRGAVRIYK